MHLKIQLIIDVRQGKYVVDIKCMFWILLELINYNTLKGIYYKKFCFARYKFLECHINMVLTYLLVIQKDLYYGEGSSTIIPIGSLIEKATANLTIVKDNGNSKCSVITNVINNYSGDTDGRNSQLQDG